MSILRLLFGRPLATGEEQEERIGPMAGVAVLGLDAIASAAYGPEALLTVLLPLGAAGTRYMPRITLVIGCLLLILAGSYWQTIDAYPNGGGAYTVAKENLGTKASLFAAAALLLDYLLNVAVAISAGVGALVSAVPSLLGHTLSLCLAVLALLTVVNLRGVRAAGLAFMAPTYLFIGCMSAVIAIGAFKAATVGAHPPPILSAAAGSTTSATASTWLLLRAFANGCTALTGVEAVSNGVPLFRRPSANGARRTLLLIIAVLVVLLGGVAFLCLAYKLSATSPGQEGYQSILSQAVTATVGRGWFYYITMASIIAVLTLSANTSFAGMPRVCRMLAADRFLPELFVHRGRRLVFTHGILVLAALAAVLLMAFGGVTDRLIPLFAIGALFAFTMSQVGMVGHWRKQRGGHALRSLILNFAGATATGLTLCIVVVSKFAEGAWIAVLLVLATMVLFRAVRRHYDFIAQVTATDASLELAPPKPPIAVVPLRRWDAISLKALSFAVGLSRHVIAVQVLTEDREVDNLAARWNELAVVPVRKLGLAPPELMVRRSPFRDLVGPLLDAVTELAKTHPDRQIAVVVPELIESRWVHHLLHAHTAMLLKTLLLYRGGPQMVVISAPWYLRDWAPERSRLVSYVTRLRFGRRRSPPSPAVSNIPLEVPPSEGK